MSFEKLLTLSVILFYFFGTLGIFVGTLAMRRQLKIAANWLTLAGFALHTLAIIMALFTEPWLALSAGYFIQVLSWVLILLYLVAWRFLRMPFLALTAAPLALLLYILSLRLGNVKDVLPENLSGLFFGLHVCSLFISFGLLTMAFGAGIIFIYMERKIKTKMPIAQCIKDFPALGIYDKINKFAVTLGFPLYTLGLMSSVIWLPLRQSQFENPKIILSLLTWFLFAVLFYQRLALGYQGRKTARMAIITFTVAAISLALDFFTSHHSVILQVIYE